MSEESLNDPGLLQLREQTKNVMIPLLIKAFRLRSEGNRLSAPPSRLCKEEKDLSKEEVIARLSALADDLEQQRIWIESGKNQVEKILAELQEEGCRTKCNRIETNTKGHVAAQSFFHKTFSRERSPSSEKRTRMHRIRSFLCKILKKKFPR